MKHLLGENDGVNYYLESPSWDCNWYWGFGYISGYERGQMTSHQHADGEFIAPNTAGTGNRYNFDTNIFTGDFLSNKTFSESDGYRLRELMATFYALKTEAELYGHGGMHITTNPLKDILTDTGRAKLINEKYIPLVTKTIIDILEQKQ